MDQTLVSGRQVVAVAKPTRKKHASLVLLKGEELGRDFRLRRNGMIIGRGMEAEIRVLDDLVSREHARIDFRWDRSRRRCTYRLVDLKSTNGTFINNRRARSVALRDGDRIQVGKAVLKFVVLDEIEAKYQEEIRSRISYDKLTGLLTKESLVLALETELQRCRRYGSRLAIVMMDLDRFKTVNDQHGHQAGDRVLAEVGVLIRDNIRDVDVSARYGGEEFIAYLPEADVKAAHQAAERIRQAIAGRTFDPDGAALRTTISIGIAAFPEHGDDVKALIKRADRAMYRAKQSGRDRVCVAPTGDEDEAQADGAP
jgi:diguanylate cyclase (GGDEF)-like protein